jgi:hypothetical protein
VVERALTGGGLGVEQTTLVTSGVGETDGGGEALAEGARGDLDTLGVTVFGVTRRERTPGAKRLEVVELEAVAAQVELDVLGQGAVPDREDEAVTPEPVSIGRVLLHDLLEEKVCRGGEAHRGAGVAVAHLLDGVCRQHSDGVDRLVVDGIPLQSCHSLIDPS